LAHFDTQLSSSSTLRAALIGRGISLSKTPGMHEAEGRTLGLDYSYELIDLDTDLYRDHSLGDIIDRIEGEGFAGFNITFPFKSQISDKLSDLSQIAEVLGAVNTVVFEDGKRFGHNTDMSGFATAFQVNMTNAPLDKVLLLGIGGAGSAVAFALAECGVGTLHLFDLNPERMFDLAKKIKRNYPKIDVRCFENLDLAITSDLNGVVNATPMGMSNYPGSAFPKDAWKADMWAADIVYFPLKTAFLSDAEQAGCRVMPGSGMAIYQAVHAFELITGHKADPKRFTKAFEQSTAVDN